MREELFKKATNKFEAIVTDIQKVNNLEIVDLKNYVNENLLFNRFQHFHFLKNDAEYNNDKELNLNNLITELKIDDIFAKVKLIEKNSFFKNLMHAYYYGFIISNAKGIKKAGDYFLKVTHLDVELADEFKLIDDYESADIYLQQELDFENDYFKQFLNQISGKSYWN
jgi:hypothetical protein